MLLEVCSEIIHDICEVRLKMIVTNKMFSLYKKARASLENNGPVN